LSKIKIKFHECLYDFLADHDREDLNKVIAELFKLLAGVLVFPLESLHCHQIAVKELFPIVIALELWGKYMVNSKVLFLSDNQYVVDGHC
jgi:hypothetical protein